MSTPIRAETGRTAVPTFGSVVLDCPDPSALATFYAALLDWPHDPEGDSDGSWVTLAGQDGAAVIEFQRVADYRAPQWPSPNRPQQSHLDLRVRNLSVGHERAVALGARVLDVTHQRFHVYADPAGHPFCLCAC